MPLVKVVRNGQITIPKKVRSLLGIHEGDFLEIQVSGKSMLIKPKIALERDLSGKEFFRLTEEMRENVKGADPDEVGPGRGRGDESRQGGHRQKD